MKVKLIDGIKRWSYKDFHIKRNEIKDVDKELFHIAGGRLEVTRTPTAKKTTYKKKAKISEPKITAKGVEFPSVYNVTIGDGNDKKD